VAGGENERAGERGRGPQSVRQPLYPMLAASTSADGTVASQTHVGGGDLASRFCARNPH
jgi:hypothetical protein